MNAIIYARQSSGSDDYSESVETQIENCRRLAEKKNLSVIGCFSDLNTSGKTYPAGAENVAENDRAFQYWFSQQTGTRKYRSGLGNVFRNLENADYLIVDEMTRLYRPVTRSFLESFVNQKLIEYHVQILQCKGGALDLNQFDQQLIQTLKNQIQDEAIANQKKKSKEQFRKLRDAGYMCNGAKMFGIRYLGNRKIEVIPECAEVIRFIYQSIVEYQPYSAIIRAVNLKYRHCFRKYCYESTFYSIARQPIYCGYQYNSSRELIRNMQIAGQEIVSYELWRKVINILNTKKKEAPVRAKKHWLPMSGRLVCGCCGGKMTCQIDRGVLYYICNKANLIKNPGCCRTRIRFMESSDQCNGLYEAAYPLLLFGLMKRLQNNLDTARSKEELDSLRHKLMEMKEKEQILIDLFMAESATQEQMREMLHKHREKRLEIQSRVQLLSSIKVEALDHERKILIPELFAKIRGKRLEHSYYEQLFKDSIQRVLVREDQVEFGLPDGILILPRIRWKRKRFFPPWRISPAPDAQTAGLFRSGQPIEIVFTTGKCGILYQDEHFIFKTE